jgi:putative PIG3 family NAD(P)H quinone oxidoreductase
VLIDVAAAGINGADIAQRRGRYPSPHGAPEWPGMEVSGTVSAVGSAASRYAVGDQVCSLVPGGGYAERVVAAESLVLPVPRKTSLIDAAGLPEVMATVYSNLVMYAGLRAGDTLLVHGGSSGIGTAAIQLGVALDCRVFATAGSDAKVEFCDGLGATGINYRTQDFVDVVGRATANAGVNVILDMVGGDYLARDIDTLATDGRIMVIANQSGEQSSMDLNRLMGKRGRIWATTLRSRPLAERVAILDAVYADVWPLIESGAVRPIIDSVFPLARAADAHRRMESDHVGKILLTVAAEAAT